MNRVLAQQLSLPWGDSSQPVAGLPLQFQTLGDLVSQPVIKYVFAFAGIGLLLMLVSSGFNFLTSGGDAKKLETARSRLTYAIVGFIVIFVAYWLVQILGKIFGVEIIQNIFK